MKTQLMYSCVLLLNTSIVFSQVKFIPPPNLIELGITNLNYDYRNEKETRIFVNTHYVAEYLESNFQYNQFLEYLANNNLDSLWQQAQPKKDIWDSVDLDLETKEYLKGNYWTSNSFSDYPILGLNFHQINKYLKWKTKIINVAYLEMNGKNIPENIEAYEVKEEISKNKTGITSIRLPTFQESISMFEQARTKKIKKRKSNSHKFEEWLENNPSYKHLMYTPKKEKSKKDIVKIKLKKIGINPVIKSKLSKLMKSSKSEIYELILDDPRLASFENYQKNDRSVNDIQSVNVVYEKRSIQEVRIIEGETPFLGFRVNSTKPNKHRKEK